MATVHLGSDGSGVFVYLLTVDVYSDEHETDWVDGWTGVFATQSSAYEYFKAWVDGRGYAVPTWIEPIARGRFMGDDVEGFMPDAETPCFMSWGINEMEVHK